ncbi:VacB/RNase II family 3'-5' exoribonuclease [Spartinivicinus poritis]|uniref:exoribonuclease II n=1 Tax=Spartinivicinus poritis TaxID=2994640 RepID=A0ABT5U2I8_9GAMM|nr:VacB/RNase II family 3'-5' exoribonuclease [Spartinivicinus sp. A2-2]MDE1460579.1 VacB/RNase II family 3'-5' exoribonuclease [Spartinivicinus sp. A2-2]
MLSNDSLAQLKQLKQQLKAQKQLFQGKVKDSPLKTATILLDDGRQALLNAEEAQRVLPHDLVKVTLTGGKGSQLTAEIEELVRSDFKEFTGKIVIKGKAVFVDPDYGRMNRWIFIPPKQRGKAQAGDYVRCRLVQHPIKNGKPQAEVLTVIGNDKQPGIEANYVINKYQLQDGWSEAVQQQVEQILATGVRDKVTEQHQDLTAIPFVTIDSAATQDMDDALFAEANEDGSWRVIIAIADPASWVEPGTPVDQAARERGMSVYLPGRTLAMLPEALSNDRCSLMANQERLALVCEMQLATDGEIKSYQFYSAVVCSKAKLSYESVSEYIEQGNKGALGEANEILAQTVDSLYAVQQVLTRYREQQAVSFDNKPDYNLVLNEQQKIASIEKQQRLSAHKLVEECMVAANRCAAQFIKAKAANSGIYITNAGLRKERLDDVAKLLEQQLPTFDFSQLSDPMGYRQVLLALNNQATEVPVKAILSRQLERSLFSNEPLPHAGMGFDIYTTFTSPIRKYNDLLMHRLIKALLLSQPVEPTSNEVLEQLQQQQYRTRQATNEMEQWLICQYLQDKTAEVFQGKVVQLNSFGFTVRLDDNGVEGFVDARKLPQSYSFDPLYQTLHSKDKEQRFTLEQAVSVQLLQADVKRRSVRFTLVN